MSLVMGPEGSFVWALNIPGPLIPFGRLLALLNLVNLNYHNLKKSKY
jgi:hypothetical protein